MGYELDSQVSQRLRRNYAEMADNELLRLAARPDDLTEMAQQALHDEMAVRKLKVEAPQRETGRRWAGDAFGSISGYSALGQDRWARQGIAAAIVGSSPDMELAASLYTGVESGEASLTVFYDALEAGEACGCLEAAQVPFRVADVAKPREGLGIYDSPPVALSLIVAKSDRDRAMNVLREKMGLFPLQEVEEADPVVDDGTVATLGDFARREDADDVARALDEARIWHRLVANPEGSAETEDAWTVEVREIDLIKAGDVVEKALE